MGGKTNLWAQISPIMFPKSETWAREWKHVPENKIMGAKSKLCSPRSSERSIMGVDTLTCAPAANHAHLKSTQSQSLHDPRPTLSQPNPKKLSRFAKMYVIISFMMPKSYNRLLDDNSIERRNRR